MGGEGWEQWMTGHRKMVEMMDVLRQEVHQKNKLRAGGCVYTHAWVLWVFGVCVSLLWSHLLPVCSCCAFAFVLGCVCVCVCVCVYARAS